MGEWQHLLETAIVGTGQTTLRLDAADELAARFDATNQEATLLRLAGVVATRKKAGILLTENKETNPPPAPIETLVPLTGKQKALWKMLHLDSAPHALHAEFYSLMAQRRKHVPHEWAATALGELPALIARQPEVAKLLLPVLGERARWYAEHYAANDAVFITERPEDHWRHATFTYRLFALNVVREKDPASARQMLAETWASEAAKERQQFLEALQRGLCEADEAFLTEIMRQDRSREVRQTALNLLASLPQSAVVEEATARAAQHLQWQKGGIFRKGAIEVTFPPESAELENGDLLHNVLLFASEKVLGKKALNLAKLLSLVPPSHWLQTFNCQVGELKHAALKSEWKNALIIGFGVAAERFSDAAFLVELAGLKLEGGATPFGAHRTWPEGINPTAFAALTDSLLQKEGPQLLLEWLSRQPQPMSDELEKKVLTRVVASSALAMKNAGRVSLWTYRHFLLGYALQMRAENLPYWLETLELASRDQENEQNWLQEVLELMRLRREIHEAFAGEE